MKNSRILVILILFFVVFQVSFGTVKGLKNQPHDNLSSPFNKKTRENSHYLPDKVIVKLRQSIQLNGKSRTFGLSGVDKILERFSISSIEQIFPERIKGKNGKELSMTNFYVINFLSPVDPFSFAEELSNLPEVEYAEPWFIYPISDVTSCRPNDTFRNYQWGLDKISADTAWCIEQGDTNVVIGIIDTGVQWDHPDLQSNIYINKGEWGPDGLGGNKQNNGIDDDGNGFIDDWHGWDFGGSDYNNPRGDNNPSPVNTQSAHGTHVAGIASAVTNNGAGVAGVGYKCKILPVKTSSDNDTRGGGYPYIIYGFEGILYAASMGATVINCSWGGDGASQFEQEVIDSALALGAIVTAAAGNTYSNDVQYPASYNGVISVTATNSSDIKSSYSTYNGFVDVSAPGDGIYSTYYPSGYTSMTGTSMATPFVAGLVALVKSHFPYLNSLQLGEQVRVSCDNINSLNPSYADLLGKGRINALKALTISSPSVRMITYSVSDSGGGNNNGILQPNETISIFATFKNYLSPTNAGATVTLTTSDSYVQIIDGSFPIGILNTLATIDNNSSPFHVHINSNVPPSHEVVFKLLISDGSYSDYQFFSILINPTFATHNVNNVEVSLTNIGRIGFTDLAQTGGSGFVFGGDNQLYEGGLIIGYSPTKLIDVVRNDTCGYCQDNDFSTSQVYDMVYPGIISNQDGSTVFSDSAASPTNKIGLKVNMYSYAFTSPEDSNYIIVRYDVKNISGSDITGLYAGLFFDWDIVGSQANYWSYNRTTFDASLNLGYAWNSGNSNSVYCGARVLEGSAGYKGLVNNTSISLNRSAKWNWLSSGVVTVDSIADIHFVISSGPHDIANGASKTIAFAILGGRNLLELQSSAEAALSKWVYIKKLLDVDEKSTNLPTNFALKQNYPNPFNPITTIEYDLPVESKVTLKIFDVLGREVSTLVNKEQRAGRYSIEFDASQLSSGTYFYRIDAGTFFDVKKFLLIR